MRNLGRGRIIWFVGLSGAGKSTLCSALEKELQNMGQTVAVLDGDQIRQGLCSDLGFSEEDRYENIRRVACVADIIATSGVTVLIATISPLQRFRDLARSVLPEMTEVFVDAPLTLCEQRDPKGLYHLARMGKLPGFTGVGARFEPPVNPELICQTAQESILECTEKLLKLLGIEVPDDAPVKRRPTIAVDFDGVLAEYNGWKGEKHLGALRKDVVGALVELKSEGWKVVVHTTRGEADVLAFLQEGKVPFDEINKNSDYRNSGHKPVATVYWDDRAIRYSGDAERDLPGIRSFRTWSGRR